MEPVVHRSEGYHTAYFIPPLTRWEGLTLLTVNYSQPTSPLWRCGLYLWSRIAVWVSLAVFGELNKSTQRKKKLERHRILLHLFYHWWNPVHAMTLTDACWTSVIRILGWTLTSEAKYKCFMSVQIDSCNFAHKLAFSARLDKISLEMGLFSTATWSRSN